MKTTLITFAHVHTEAARFTDGDTMEMWGTDPDGNLVQVVMPEENAMPLIVTAIGEGRASAKVPDDQIRERRPIRKAVITRRSKNPTPATVEAYLPGNYTVIYANNEQITIGGHDNAGFTLEYARDRLASGLIGCEIQP